MQRDFIRALESKIPKKTQLANFVAEAICMEKETAYRRLRGEVPFTFAEVCLLAKKLNISLDEIVSAPKDRRVTMELQIIGEDQNMNFSGQMQTNIEYMNIISKQPYSEVGVAMAFLTDTLYCIYPHLSRFYLMRFLYHWGNPTRPSTFSEIVDENTDYYPLYHQYHTEVTNTFYIWDRKIIREIIDDLLYFKTIRMITHDEILAIKEELHQFMVQHDEYARKGIFTETGNKYELYLSDIHIDTTYAYIWTEITSVSMYFSFQQYRTSSIKPDIFEKISNWIKSLRRCSTLISGIGDRERISFFDEQHRIIDSL